MLLSEFENDEALLRNYVMGVGYVERLISPQPQQ